MPSPKPHRKAATKNRKVAHAKILTGSLHKLQLEAREAFTSKTDLKSVPEACQARTKKPKRKRSPTNSCTEPQGTKIVKLRESRHRKPDRNKSYSMQSTVILSSFGWSLIWPPCDLNLLAISLPTRASPFLIWNLQESHSFLNYLWHFANGRFM